MICDGVLHVMLPQKKAILVLQFLGESVLGTSYLRPVLRLWEALEIMAGEEEFTYTLRLKMDGRFPGAPDFDEYEIPEHVYVVVRKMMEIARFRKISDSSPGSQS